ncbi:MULTISPECIES: type II CRISPR-associated endonuclease Cas1 [unclassified Helicobacter]|uniref:type II CRISPR-associated endonuclease Cas1 n=1 Tax=unclassified Helicobacter TaxID=2593540 RepID=UPI000CF0D8ED|nr:MULTISPECIES: type II CRISPR-associated endonuclease Cas1 [unclassified Helicobacter]
MFEESYRTLFLSTPAKLSCKNNSLQILQEGKVVVIPLKDISVIVIDTPQIALSSSLLSIFADYKILVFVSDASHIPNGIFMPFLPHYRGAKVLQDQIKIKQQLKSILWQKIIQQKIYNQAQLLILENKIAVAQKILLLQKGVKLNDSTNNESKASMIYFPALFGRGFSRGDFCAINSALNYGYAIIRGILARNIVASGLLPSLGLNHHNQFNPYNLADDLIEPFRVFVDSKVARMKFSNILSLENRVELVNIINAKVLLNKKFYPMYRVITRVVWSLAKSIQEKENYLELPIFSKDSNGREIYESFGDV